MDGVHARHCLTMPDAAPSTRTLRRCGLALIAALLPMLACAVTRPARTPERRLDVRVPAPCTRLSADDDDDGLDDGCELELARQFAPELVISPARCDAERERTPPAGAYVFAV